jgi:hypothetical protein
MKFKESVVIALLLGIPLWLVARAWFRYLRLNRTAAADLSQMRMGLALISATTILWMAMLLLMILEDYSARARSVAQNVAPGPLGSINLLLCFGALMCSRFGRKSAQDTTPLRRAIGVSSGCLMVIWLFFLGNPH